MTALIVYASPSVNFKHTFGLIVCRAGLRGFLEVRNPHNIPALFQWHAREGVDTGIFFMVHPTGSECCYHVDIIRPLCSG